MANINKSRDQFLDAYSAVVAVPTNALQPMPTQDATVGLARAMFLVDATGAPITGANPVPSGGGAPSAAAASAITPAVAVGASSLVLKNSPGNFYGASTVNNTTAGFLILYNATTAPSGGAALTGSLILGCVAVGANSNGSIGDFAVPVRCSVGAVLLFSTATTTYTIPASLPFHLQGKAV